MNRILSLVAASSVALLLTGCGEQAPKPTTPAPETTQSAPAVVVPTPAATPEAAPAPVHHETDTTTEGSNTQQ